MWPLAQTTFRECWRRPFPLVSILVLGGLAVVARMFALFSFQADDTAATHLVISTVFLAGLLHAAFIGASLLRRDRERGTLGLLLSQPLHRPGYVAGRFAGAVLAAAALCLMVGALSATLLYLPIGTPVEIVPSKLGAAFARSLAPLLVLHAIAIFSSAVASRVWAPILVIGLLVAGSLAGGHPLLPDFTIMGIDAGAAPAMGVLFLYAGLFALFFLSLSTLALSLRAPTRRED